MVLIFTKALHSFFRRKTKGFSLIEMSIVLLIIGVMIGSISKGKDILDQANARAVSQSFSRLQTNILLYQSDYGGNLNESSETIWANLNSVNLLPTPEAPTSRFGGEFYVEDINGKKYLSLKGKNAEAFLTYNQVKLLYGKICGEDGEAITIIFNSSKAITNFKDIKKEELYSIAVSLE